MCYCSNKFFRYMPLIMCITSFNTIFLSISIDAPEIILLMVVGSFLHYFIVEFFQYSTKQANFIVNTIVRSTLAQCRIHCQDIYFIVFNSLHTYDKHHAFKNGWTVRRLMSLLQLSSQKCLRIITVNLFIVFPALMYLCDEYMLTIKNAWQTYYYILFLSI